MRMCTLNVAVSMMPSCSSGIERAVGWGRSTVVALRQLGAGAEKELMWSRGCILPHPWVMCTFNGFVALRIFSVSVNMNVQRLHFVSFPSKHHHHCTSVHTTKPEPANSQHEEQRVAPDKVNIKWVAVAFCMEWLLSCAWGHWAECMLRRERRGAGGGAEASADGGGATEA